MSAYDDLDYLDYESEWEWEARRASSRKNMHSLQLPRWSMPAGLDAKQLIEQYCELLKPMFEAKGWVVLGDGYNETGEGYDYYVPSMCDWAYHRSVIFQAPENRALLIVAKFSAVRYIDEPNTRRFNASLSVIGQLRGEVEDRRMESPMPVYGFYNCHGSWQSRPSIGRHCFSIHLEDCVQEGLPDPKKLLTALRHAVRRLRRIGFAAAPFVGHTFLGNNVDHSYCFSRDHSTSGSHELFWQRAGKDKILQVVPEGSFTSTRP